jgi:HNH endonuclease
MSYVNPKLRRLVIERAGNCCEYCLESQKDSPFSFHIEHIISVKHRGKTISENLCLSCPDCNEFKGSDIASADPETGNPTFLFHPRRQKWDDHFRLNGATIEPLTPEARVTEFLLHFNDSERVQERRLLIRFELYPREVDS